jgi:hypothetical protein
MAPIILMGVSTWEVLGIDVDEILFWALAWISWVELSLLVTIAAYDNLQWHRCYRAFEKVR